jgi:hypothetical protein
MIPTMDHLYLLFSDGMLLEPAAVYTVLVKFIMLNQ